MGAWFEDEGGGRYKIRWRDGKGRAAKQRAMRVEGDAIERDRLINEIDRAVRDHGFYDSNRSAVVEPAPASDLGALFEAFVAARVALDSYSARTARTYTSYGERVLGRIRELQGLHETSPVPVALLSSELFGAIRKLDTDRLSSSMASYASLRFALDAWRWASDRNAEASAAGRPARWTRLPPAPRANKDYLPRTPKYGRTIAPTLAHVDAVVRRLWANPRVDAGTKVAALFMRWTGLRSEQVFSIDRADVDLEAGTLLVRKGKSLAEQADLRTVPLATALLNERGVRAWVESQPGPLFPKRRHSATIGRDAGRTKKPTQTFHDAWQAATDAEEVPLHVWAPPNRKIARPEHSFRAAFQAHLEELRIPGNVIDFLVGHEDGSVRDMHYGRDLLVAARAAVDEIPAVDWIGPLPAHADNVVPIRPESAG